MKLILIRHTSVAPHPGICYGQSDVDLAETFPVEAEAVANQIRHRQFDAVYGSPLSRCRKLASHCGYEEPILDNRLMELNFGNWEMQNWDEINDPHLQTWYNDWIYERPTGGESFHDMVLRVNEFIEELRQKNHREVCIFTHGGVIRIVKILQGHFPIEDAFRHSVEFGEVVEFDI
ncbi:alpha-ribazole phosphatase [Parabacteroides sp. FAFU027]|uniref:alpha-ribazole phosphatase n=1 Tax=Parabacteroides sp. FAFU027 TaxID=2922715 RepID=UPI001FAFD526|nr:alpha-ribazole phosphatase [Parabacteroides sp. FAFU027]